MVMSNFWLDRQLDKISDNDLSGEIKEFVAKFDLWNALIDWQRDLQLQDLYIHIESNHSEGVTAIETLYSPFPKPETGKLLKIDEGSTPSEALTRILLEHYVALGYE